MTHESPDSPRIPGFDHVRSLGRGRFADVHLFQQAFPRRLVAIKVMREQLGWESGHAFELEANALATLSTHPCIVAIHDAGRSPDGLSYLVMEYCPLPSLAHQIRSGSLSLEDSLRIGILVAGALDTAHAHGILHRDVKPANILMTDYGAPQLADFGIASSASDRNVVSGFTPAWAAPELINDPSRASVETDVYALAATVYTMLVGRAPHERPDAPNSAAHVMARAFEPVPRLTEGQGVPPPLADLLDRALSVQPHERFRSARLFGAALQAVEAELGLPRTQMVLVDPPRRASDEQTSAMSAVATMWSEANDRTLADTPESRSGRRRRGALAAAAALVCVAGAAAVVLTLTHEDDPLRAGGPTSSSSETPAPRETETTTVLAEPPLPLDAPYVNLPCNGEYIIGLGTSEGDAEGVEKLAERLEGVPRARYLKNRESCEAFEAESEVGDLYQVYLGPFETLEQACDKRRALQSAALNEWLYRAWVKHVEEGAEVRELCICKRRAQDLPLLTVGQSPEQQRDYRPVVIDLQLFLKSKGINDAEEPVEHGWYTAQVAEMVRVYQADADLVADGEVTEPVWAAIKRAYCDDS